MLPDARTWASVWVSSTGAASDCARTGPTARLPSPATRNATNANFLMTLARKRMCRRGGLGFDLAQPGSRIGFREQLALPLGDDRGGDRIADRVGRGSPHVEEGVHAEDQQQARLRNVELVQRRRNHHEGR